MMPPPPPDIGILAVFDIERKSRSLWYTDKYNNYTISIRFRYLISVCICMCTSKLLFRIVSIKKKQKKHGDAYDVYIWGWRQKALDIWYFDISKVRYFDMSKLSILRYIESSIFRCINKKNHDTISNKKWCFDIWGGGGGALTQKRESVFPLYCGRLRVDCWVLSPLWYPIICDR